MHTTGDFSARNDLARKREVVAGIYAGATAVLSPMAGVTDLVFRAVCREHGAQVTFCEFVSADGIVHGNEATRELMELGPDEHPVGIQLFGADPQRLAEAAAQDALTLERVPKPPEVPARFQDNLINLGKARGKLSSTSLGWMAIKSKLDRLLASRG